MQEDPTAWAAYVKMAVKDRVHVPMDFKIPGLESPLGARLMRRASRPGDGVAYGQHGPWGAYREGVKEMSEKINKGKFTAMEAHLLLEQEGVHASAWSLAEKARLAPGKSPVKHGPSPALSEETRSTLDEEVRFLRKHNLPVTKQWVKSRAVSIVKGTPEEAKLPGGVMSDHVYYKFLDQSDMTSADVKPLESDRDLWLTSKVHNR